MSLYFPWTECPECGSKEVYDSAADDAPVFQLECRECDHEWEATGFGFTLEKSGGDEIEGVPV